MEALRPDDPERVGPFVPLARIGVGGMGRVYLARSRGGRPVAVKVIRAEYAHDPQFRTRFRREVEAARTVSGLYTAPVLDAGPDDDTPWLATAYIPGPSLQTVIREHGPLPERSARILGAGIAEALGAIHSAGLIHRDLKPSNVICGPDGPRVIDFGISHAVDGTSLTATGLVVGSPRYSSPEQCRTDATIVPASDVFALGGILVYATTGVPPFGDGPDPVQLYLVVHEQPDLASVPPAMRELVAACLAKDPGQRPSIDELLDGLLPPGMATSEDWLPTAVGTTLRSYAVTVAVEGTGGTPTHEAEPKTTRGAATTGNAAGSAADGTVAGLPSTMGSFPGALDSLRGGVPQQQPQQQSPASVHRRRVLTGILGIGAMAASGGGAWWAATRHDKASAQSPVGNATTGASITTTTPAATPSATPTPTPTPSPATESPTPSASPSDGLPKLKPVWNAPFDVSAGGAIYVRNNLLIGLNSVSQSSIPTLIAIDTGTGKSPWSVPLSAESVADLGATTAADSKAVYARLSSEKIAAYSLSTGKPLWTLPYATPEDASVVGLQGSMLYFASTAITQQSSVDSVLAFDVNQRKSAWTLKPADLFQGLPSGLPAPLARVHIAVPDAGGLIFASYNDQTPLILLIRALDPATGKKLWEFSFKPRGIVSGQQSTPTFTVAGGKVFMTDMSDGCLHAFTTAGKWQWTHPDPDAVPDKSKPVAGFVRNVVLVGSTVYALDGTTLRAFDAASGTPLPGNAFAAPSGLPVGPVALGNSIVVEATTPTSALGSTSLTVLDGATGQPSAAVGVTVDASGLDFLAADQTKLYVVSAAAKQVVAYQGADLGQ